MPWNGWWTAVKWRALRQQHALYFGNLVINEIGLQLYSAKALYWLNWIEREHDNVRATLSWTLTVPQGIELGAGLVFTLNWFWYRRGYFIEGRMWAERVLASPGNAERPPPLRALVLQSSGMLAIWQGEQDIGLAQLQESLAIEQRQEDEFMVAAMLLGNGVALINMGRDSAAKPLLEEARAYFKEQKISYFHLFHAGSSREC